MNVADLHMFLDNLIADVPGADEYAVVIVVPDGTAYTLIERDNAASIVTLKTLNER